ncbi:MAG: hypothetical protein V3U75_01270 [Methylococcaceae bacterium]
MAKKKEAAPAPEATPVVEETQPKSENLGDSDREAMYANYEKDQEIPAEDTDTSPEEDDTGIEDGEETPEEEEYTEPAPEDAEGEEESDDKKPEEDEKTVPYGALHAEREKRKEIQKTVGKLEGQVAELIADNKAFMEQGKKADTDETDLEALLEEGNFDDVLKLTLKQNTELKKRMAKLENNDGKRTQADEQTAHEAKQKAVEGRISKITTSLEEDGYPGFDMFVDKMNAELVQMIDDDPDNEALDNDEGYKKIYREKIFPKVKKMFVGQEKENTFEKKRNLKKKANIGGGGKADPKTKEKDINELSNDEMYADYKKQRALYSHS